MATFFVDLWESIFTPGATPTLLVATNVTFAALQGLLLTLLITTHNVHFLILSILSAGLWTSINWFAREVNEHQRQEEEKLRRARTAPAVESSEESETEVEVMAASVATRRGEEPEPTAQSASVDMEPAEQAGVLKQRILTTDASSQGTKSSVSTEDEWEKVSESDEKSK